jgi:hypothetical protein
MPVTAPWGLVDWAGVEPEKKSEKAQTEQMSPALRPKADIPCVFMSTRLIARRENRFGGL